MKIDHALTSKEKQSAAALWIARRRMGMEFRARMSPAPCSSVHDGPCTAGDPDVVYRYKRTNNHVLSEFMRDPHETFCICGRTEYWEGPA